MKNTRLVEPIVRLNAVSKLFGRNGTETAAARDVSLEVYRGEMILLLGPSGSGKTTLLTLMAGLARPSAGDVNLFGKDVARYGKRELQQLRARRIGFVFQTFQLIDPFSVAENINLPQRFAGRSGGNARRRTAELIKLFELTRLASKRPTELSQGEKQRVAIARALANDADLIIADEPTASLETKQALEVARLLQTLARDRGKGVVIASHDLRMVEFADRVLRMTDGGLSEITVEMETRDRKIRSENLETSEVQL